MERFQEEDQKAQLPFSFFVFFSFFFSFSFIYSRYFCHVIIQRNRFPVS